MTLSQNMANFASKAGVWLHTWHTNSETLTRIVGAWMCEESIPASSVGGYQPSFSSLDSTVRIVTDPLALCVQGLSQRIAVPFVVVLSGPGAWLSILPCHHIESVIVEHFCQQARLNWYLRLYLHSRHQGGRLLKGRCGHSRRLASKQYCTISRMRIQSLPIVASL